MSKSTSNNDPFGLGVAPDSPPQNLPRGTSKPKASDPFGLGVAPEEVKKKDGGADSGTSSTTPVGGPSTSTLGSQLPTDANLDKAISNWNSKTLTGDDVQVMSKYGQGQQLGFDNLTKQGMDRYANSHNAGTIQGVADKAKDITTQWAPVLKSADKGSFQQQMKGTPPDNNIDGLVRAVSSGDPDAIYTFKNKVNDAIDGQIKAIQGTPQGATQTVSGGGMGYGGIDYKTTSAAQKQQIKALEDQKKTVADAYDEYASTSLVNVAQKMPGGISESNNLMWVGRNLRRLSQSVKDFKAQQDIPHDSNAATERNYLDEKAGYDAAIGAITKMHGQDFTNAVTQRSEQLKTSADLRALQLNQMIDKRNTLSQKYLPVDVYNTARVLSDKMASKTAYNTYVTSNDVQNAVQDISKDGHDFLKDHGQAIAFIQAHPNTLALGGFAGGAQRGFKPPEWIERLTTGKTRAEEDIEKQFDASEQGTSYAGKTPGKVVLDNQGKEFIEKPNENYGNTNFNSIVGNMGEFSSNMVIYGLLTEGIGAGVGTAAKAVTQAAKTIGRVEKVSGLVGSTYLLNYDNNAKIADGLIKDDSDHGDFKKGLVANLMTMGQAAAMSILPANQFLRNNFQKIMGSDALGVLASENANGLTKDLTEKFLDKVKTRALSVLKEAKDIGIQTAKADAEMILTNHSNALIESMFDETGKTKKNDVLSDDVNTIRDVTLGSLAFGLPRLAKASFPMTYRDALYDAAVHADENVARIQQLQEDGQIDREKGNGIIKLIKTAKEHLPDVLNARTGDETDPEAEGAGLPLSNRQKKQMLAERVRGSILEEQAKEGAEDPEVKKAQSQANSGYQEVKHFIPYLPSQIETDETGKTTPEGGKDQNAQGKEAQSENTEGAGPKSQEENVNSEDRVTVKEMLDKAGTYNGVDGQFYQDGQTVIFKEEGRPREHELGNIEEIGDHSIKDYGIDQKNSVVKASGDNISVRGKKYVNNYSDPLAAINRDEKGNIVSVNLETPDGEKRTFRGDVAEDIAYQIHLKAISDGNEREGVEDFINDDEGSRKAIDDARPSEALEEGGPENPGQVQRTKVKKKSPVNSDKNEKDRAKKERPEDRQRAEGGQNIRVEGKEDGDGVGDTRQSQEDVKGKGPAGAEPEEVGPSQLAKEAKENHVEAIQNIERKQAKAEKSGKELSDKDSARMDDLKRKVQLIDKFDRDDIIKHLRDAGVLKQDC